MDLAQQFMQDVTRDARARIDGRQNEKGLEHDGIVIPVTGQRLHAGNAAEYLRHSNR